ncbi:PAS domain-containing protein [Fluoribacter dumoffii]|uniref:PAS domain-containing protein n=1 Tax=Fluoribacter dumoffii TaxID=463 RepID=UPI002243D639|nr:PAS domain-containing protein [Fluoribacter dumoffii]MCW8387611.1 PAS domain-containing protein [Fluoribacter dumoffii]MCW8497814.1 PAS domain-containing protein [Fluoribacter dumoffii]
MNEISNFALQALNSANDGITIVDMKHKSQPLVFINSSFEQLTGYRAEEVIGTNCRFLQGSLPPQPETLLIRKALGEQKNCRIILKNKRKNGSLFWNELSLAPIKEENKTLSFYIGIQKDVTKEIKHHKEFMNTLEQNKKDAMYEAISSFTDKVSQPLTAISIYSRACCLIMEKEKQDRLKLYEGLEKIEAQSLVIKEIMQTVHNNFNELNFPVEQLNPNKLIVQLVNIIKYACPYNIQLTLDPQLPEIKFNQEHLSQILLNLIRNSTEAFQRASRLKGHITISTAKQTDFIELTIADDGPGMPKEFIHKEPGTFFTSKTYGIGTGLGICKKLIHLYGGSISLKEMNTGLKVIILLPI